MQALNVRVPGAAGSFLVLRAPVPIQGEEDHRESVPLMQDLNHEVTVGRGSPEPVARIGLLVMRKAAGVRGLRQEGQGLAHAPGDEGKTSPAVAVAQTATLAENKSDRLVVQLDESPGASLPADLKAPRPACSSEARTVAS